MPEPISSERLGKRRVGALLADVVDQVESLPATALRDIYPALVAAEKETVAGLRAWLKENADGNERYTAHRHRQLLLQLRQARKAAAKKLRKEVPSWTADVEAAMNKGLNSARMASGDMATSHIQRELETFDSVFGHGMTLIEIDRAAVMARGEQTLVQRHEASAHRYAGAVWQDMKAQLALSVVRNETIDQMTDRLQRMGGPKGLVDLGGGRSEVIAEGLFKKYRHWAERVARTETIHSYNTFADETLRSAAELDPDICRRWDASLDNRLCVTCQSLHGEVAEVDKPFSNGEMFPPAHPNCRCAVVAWHEEWKDDYQEPPDARMNEAAQEKRREELAEQWFKQRQKEEKAKKAPSEPVKVRAKRKPKPGPKVPPKPKAAPARKKVAKAAAEAKPAVKRAVKKARKAAPKARAKVAAQVKEKQPVVVAKAKPRKPGPKVPAPPKEKKAAPVEQKAAPAKKQEMLPDLWYINDPALRARVQEEGENQRELGLRYQMGDIKNIKYPPRPVENAHQVQVPTKEEAKQVAALRGGHAVKSNVLSQMSANETYVVWLEDEKGNKTKAIFKPSDGETPLRVQVKVGTYWKREEAASNVADHLGVGDLVPKTVARGTLKGTGPKEGGVGIFKGGGASDGCVQQWVDTTGKKKGDPLRVSKHDMERMRAFDIITGNTDRHGNNVLYQKLPDGRHVPVLIDNGLSFPKDYVEWFVQPTEAMERKDIVFQPVEKQTVEWLRRIDDKAVMRSLFVDSGLERGEVELVMERLHLLKHEPSVLAIHDRPADQIDYWRARMNAAIDVMPKERQKEISSWLDEMEGERKEKMREREREDEEIGKKSVPGR